MKVLYTGSFDPITNGHLDLIRRCSRKFECVVVTVFNNKSKEHFFTANERCKLIKEAITDLDNVVVDITEDMVVNYAKKNQIDFIVRGLRAVSDYEYELMVASINKHMYPELETFFMIASPDYSFISSSIVKEVAMFGGDISSLVPPNVAIALKDKIGRELK
ncbi:pantetheine-phosphate adenylyltransferase [Sedimentibacter sp. zth1]|uniref:pantetheine-phosphate adenylyltransferase n=1 Tax=Sedimentibacter sp. zth1 TaxID=2816908 RepID=UPI001A911A0F|nr:pantetheine-phosphate adenylyltransferase [Sedimentibacter sp. zth1]QSX06610.1 pantetheine-phosphate adenylyltransferase [Sedimentibacter sp. zth1]